MADDRNKLMAKADKLVRQGKVEQAIGIYRDVLSQSRKDMNLKNKVGDLHVRAGQIEDAVALFNDIADHYADEGFYLKAIAMLKKTNKLAPAETASYLKLADLYAKQGLVNDARSQYQQVAEVFTKAGDSAKAASAFEKLLELDPTNIKLHMRLAEMYGKAGNEGKALLAFQRVGEELAKTGMHEEALKIYDKGLSSTPSHDGLLAGKFRSLTAAGRAKEAIQVAGSALAANDESVALHAAVADACAKVGDHNRERQMLERLVELEPDNTTWMERLAVVGDAAPAKVSAPPTPATPASEVPDFSEMSGDFTMEELEEVSGQWDSVDLAPEPSEGQESGDVGIGATEVEPRGERSEFITEHMTEAEVFIKYGLVEKAIDNLEAIVSRYPDEAESLRRLKDLYLESGNKPKAAERCVDLAVVYRSQGDASKAMELLAEARAHDPMVQVDRTAAEPAAAPEMAPSEAEYTFGEVPVEMESSPPASGVELDFDAPSDSDLHVGVAPSADDGIELSFDDDQDREEDAVEVSFDDHEAEDESGGIDFSVAAPEASTDPSDGDLSEVTFYIEQGFQDQARARLMALKELYPESARVTELLASLEVPAAPKPAEEAAEDEGIEFFDDAIQKPQRDDDPFELGTDSSEDSLFDQEDDFFGNALDAPAAAAVGTSSGEFEDDSIEAIFEEFKKGVEEKVGAEDYETHYNLGIAYKEMGLTDEAIAEFQLASKDESKFMDACSNLGLCFREKGMPKLAVKWYEKALAKLDPGSVQYVAILYDLGQAFEESGDKEKALEMYTDVYGLDAGFREVAEKLRSLGS